MKLKPTEVALIKFRRRPGQEASLVPPMFEPDVFRKEIYSIEESTCDIVGSFRRPRSDSAPGESCPPSLRHCVSGNVHAIVVHQIQCEQKVFRVKKETLATSVCMIKPPP